MLEQTTRLRVNLVAASEGEILQAIERLYESGQSMEEIVEELLKLGSERLASTTEQDAPMIRLADRIITEAVNRGASDIHIQPEEKIVRVRLRHDGVLSAGFLVPKEIQPALIARFKIIGAMDIAENRRPQGGRGNATVAGRQVSMRLSSLPTSFGESIVIRLLDRGNLPLNLQTLGFDPPAEQAFRAVLDRPHGIILVTGPTGSGKTTTLYAALSLINGAESSIFTLEDPIEYIFEPKGCHITQREVHTHTRSFSAALRAALREDPDVIMVGELRDLETISLAITAAETGHLVLGTLHTGNTSCTLDRLLDVFPVDQQEQIRIMVSESLRGIVSQQLVPRRDGKARVLALETLTNTPAVANVIREAKTYMLPGIIQTGKKQGMQLMGDALTALRDQGSITVEEAGARLKG